MILDNVKKLCTERGISVAQLEADAGIPTNAIYKWKFQNPGVERVKAVADYFGVTVDELLKEET